MSQPSSTPFPSTGGFVEAVRSSSRSLRQRANITITEDSIKRILLSPAFTDTFARLKTAHGMVLPLNFPSVLAELNVLCILSLLNFASGYRVPLHVASGRGAFDTIRALIFSMFITSDTEGDHLSAKGMQTITEGQVADFMGLANKVHEEKDHDEIPGVKIGQLGGPVWELVQLVTMVMKETGDILVKNGYQNLGAFVVEALEKGEKEAKGDPERMCDFVLERFIRAFPAFQDMTTVQGEPVYCFKKALLTLHAIVLRFGSLSPAPFPIPQTTNLPVFSDNVIPSLLIHLGVIDLSTSNPSYRLNTLFPDSQNKEKLDSLLAAAPLHRDERESQHITPPKEGPLLTTEQAFTLRAAAIDACELIVETAKKLTDDDLKQSDGKDLGWLKNITLPEIDAWIWAVAKDRSDYRQLERFALRNTVYF
ncbi:Queuosine 5'-phosphate N-glycosylase/hydrolase [Abortiporus biennis]